MSWLACLSIATSFAQPSYIVLPKPESDTIALEAVIALPELGPRDELALMAVTDSLLEGTEEYSKAQLQKWGSQTGRRPVVELMPGFIHIGISMPKGQGVTGVSLLDSLLRHGQFTKATLDQWTAKSRGSDSSYWQAALWPSMPKARDLRQTDVPEAYRRYFRPENATIGIGGAYTPTEESKLRARFGDWNLPKAIRSPFDAGRRVPTLANKTKVSTIEIRSPDIRPLDVDFPTKLLAIYALGVGKGSSLFRVVRESGGFSYRQEAVLWPVANGFQLRMIVARVDAGFDPATSDQWRTAMIADAEAFTDESLKRAVGAAIASLEFGLGYQPIYLSGRGSIGESIEDQTLLRAFWKSKTGVEWDSEKLLASMRSVKLEDLKATAKSILEGSTTMSIIGMGK